MKLGRLGFTGNSIKNRTETLGIYRPETNANIQSYNGELDNYTYSGKFLDLSAQIGGFEHITCMVMHPDGTKLYLLKNGTSFDGTAFGASTGTKTIYQIDLSEPWNIVSGTYNNIFLELPISNFFTTTSNRNPQVMGIAFRPDGSKFYILTRRYTTSSYFYSERKIFQYSTAISENAWNISTYTYDNVFLDMGSTGYIDGRLAATSSYTISADTDLYFNSEGTEMFIICDARYPNVTEGTSTSIDNDAIQKWTMGNEWDIQNAYIDTAVYTVPQDNNGISFNSDFSKVYLAGSSSLIWQYDLITSGTFANGTQNGQSKNIYPYAGYVQSVLFVNSNKPLYFCSSGGYIFSSGFNENLSVTLNTAISAQGTDPINFKFNNDGTRLYILNLNPNKIVEYNVSPAYSITGLTATGVSLTFDPTVVNTSVTSFHFNSNGSRLYTSRINESQSVIEQYNLSINYDLSTASLQVPYIIYSIRQDASTPLYYGSDLYFKSDGSKLFILTSDGGTQTSQKVHQLNLSPSGYLAPYPGANYTSASLSVQNTSSAGGTNASSNTDNKSAITFSSDGTYLILLEKSTGSLDLHKIFQYQCQSQWEISNATLLTGTSRNVATGTPYSDDNFTDVAGIEFSPDGQYMYVSVTINYNPFWVLLTYQLQSGGIPYIPNLYDYLRLNVDGSLLPTYIAFKFKPDGYRMYFLRIQSQSYSIVSYNLNTAWNTSTQSTKYTSPNILLSDLKSFYFRNDGFKIYFLTRTSLIYEFDVEVAWDIRTINADLYQIRTTSECVDLYINSDDSYLFTGEVNSSTTNNNIIRRYAPTSGTFPYDISNYSISGISTNVFGSNTSVNALKSFYFKPDGSKIYALSRYAVGSNYTHDVREWSLDSNWNLGLRSSTSKTTMSLSLRITNENLTGIGLSNGSSIITLNNRDSSNYCDIRSYPLDTSWDVNSLALSKSVLDVSSQTTASINDLFFDSTQQNLYFIDNYQIFHFKLKSGGTVGRISDYEYFNKISVTTSWGIPNTSILKSILFRSTGSRVYLTFYDATYPNFGIFQIDLDTNWNLTSGNLPSIKIVNPSAISNYYSPSLSPAYLLFNSTGTKIYFGYSNLVYEFDLSVAWDIGSEIKGIFDTAVSLRRDNNQIIIDNRPNSIFINSDKNKLYFTGSSSAVTIYKRDIPSYSSISEIEPFENGKFLYIGYYSGFLGGTEQNNAKICGFSNGKGDGFDTFCVVASDNKIYQFEVIKS